MVTKLILSFAFMPLLLMGASASQPASNAPAASNVVWFAQGCSNGGSFLTFPTWYDGLEQNVPKLNAEGEAVGTECHVAIDPANGFNDFWVIILNLLEILLQLAGYVALAYLIWGGFKYIKSQGNPQDISSAKSTILRAIIGLAVALGSVAIVNFVASVF